MGISASDVIPLSDACANFSELAEEVKAGAEKIITRHGERCVALIDAKRLICFATRRSAMWSICSLSDANDRSPLISRGIGLDSQA
jgi:prevent-host-death family protein